MAAGTSSRGIALCRQRRGRFAAPGPETEAVPCLPASIPLPPGGRESNARAIGRRGERTAWRSRQSRPGMEGGERADRSARRSVAMGIFGARGHGHVPCSALLLVGSETAASRPASPLLPATSLAKWAWAAYRTGVGVVPSDSDLVCTADATSRGPGPTVHLLVAPPKARRGARTACTSAGTQKAAATRPIPLSLLHSRDMGWPTAWSGVACACVCVCVSQCVVCSAKWRREPVRARTHV